MLLNETDGWNYNKLRMSATEQVAQQQDTMILIVLFLIGKETDGTHNHTARVAQQQTPYVRPCNTMGKTFRESFQVQKEV